MKSKNTYVLGTLFSIYILLVIPTQTHAQSPNPNSGGEVVSNCVNTKVNNPPGQAPQCQSASGDASDCPVKDTTIRRGSIYTPINGLGHCDTAYLNSPDGKWCQFAGTKFGIDINGKDFQDIYLPIINGHNISWEFKLDTQGSSESIIIYVGTDTTTNEEWGIQFHHSQPGSGNKNAKKSGDHAAKICGGGCGTGHVHVQIFSGAYNGGGSSWVDSAKYICKNTPPKH